MLKFISDKIIQCGDYVYTKWTDTTVVKLIKEDGTVKKEYVKIDKTEFYTTLPSCTDIVSIEGLEKLTKLNTLHCSGSKIKSFEDLFKKYKPNNIIAVGDAHYEINAVVNLYNKSNTQQRFFKTLKCVTIPSYQDILDQNKYLIKISKSLVNNKKNYDLLFKNTKR